MKRKLTLSEARLKIERYCAYQERCQKEVLDKLQSFGIPYNHAREIVVDLIQGNFLDEGRFSESFASGKFKMKGWGKMKIRKKLREKQISPRNIDLALNSIDDQEYFSKLTSIAEKKHATLKGNKFEKRAKLQRFLYNRGFESDLIKMAMDDFIV